MTPAQVGILMREKTKASEPAKPKPEKGTVADLQQFKAMRRA